MEKKEQWGRTRIHRAWAQLGSQTIYPPGFDLCAFDGPNEMPHNYVQPEPEFVNEKRDGTMHVHGEKWHTIVKESKGNKQTIETIEHGEIDAVRAPQRARDANGQEWEN